MTSDAIERFIQGLDPGRAATVEGIRRVVLASDPRVGEEIKWNSPSFSVTGHFATIAARPGKPVVLVLHAGASRHDGVARAEIPDAGGLLEWRSPDRAILTFDSPEAVKEKEDRLVPILVAWIRATQ
ncbi:MAG: DUF1801 domain-containing protein [Naasia sp.]